MIDTEIIKNSHFNESNGFLEESDDTSRNTQTTIEKEGISKTNFFEDSHFNESNGFLVESDDTSRNTQTTIEKEGIKKPKVEDVSYSVKSSRVVTVESDDTAVTALPRNTKEKATDISSSKEDGSCTALKPVCAPLKRSREDLDKLVLKVSEKFRGSIYDPYVLLYDTAATAHLIRNLELFESAPVPITDHEVNFMGFDTERGHEFPVSVGILKYPLQGVSAYYAPKCIGNIISEPLLRNDGFEIKDIRSKKPEDDVIELSRLGSSAIIKWSRGTEGVMITNLRSHNSSKPILISVSRDVPIRLNETDMIVDSWLCQLGLSSRESQSVFVLRKMSNSIIRRDAISMCLKTLTQNEREYARILDCYNNIIAIWNTNKLPNITTYSLVMESLRAISVTNPVKRDRVKNGELSCSTDSVLLDSGMKFDSLS